MIIIFVPIIIMSLFSILVLINIRQSRSRVEPTSTTASAVQQAILRSNRQRDMQFIRLAFGQVLIFMIFIVTYGIYNMYDLLTSSQSKDADRQAIESFISGLVVDLNYASISVGFLKDRILFNTFFRSHFSRIH